MKRILTATAVMALLAGPAFADLTITSNNTGKGLAAKAANGQSITYIKGSKMRTDQTIGGEMNTVILDAQTQQMISFTSKKKEAEVIDMSKMTAEITKNIATEGMTVKLTPNGQSKELLGRSTSGYDLAVSIPVKMGEMTMNMMMGGPVWIAKGAPGAEDYAGFYKMAAEKGLFFGNPDAAKAQPAQAKGMAEMYRAMAESGGMPYQTEIEIKFAGEGMMAAMMNKMGGFGITTVVTAVSTDAIPDSMFAVPAGYSTKNK
jgi:hypothetical protein